MSQQEPEKKSIFQQYHDDIKEQITVNEFNMKEVQLGLPGARHFWVSRLMHHKQEIFKLKKLKKQAKQKIVERMIAEAPVGLTSKSTDVASDEHPVVQKIDDQIIENELLVEYLSKIESNFRSVSYDIGNIIKIIQLETT
jgi:beta-glucosidase/6-phospho-beta-glucosidase/beta-galactosidase